MRCRIRRIRVRPPVPTRAPLRRSAAVRSKTTPSSKCAAGSRASIAMAFSSSFRAVSGSVDCAFSAFACKRYPVALAGWAALVGNEQLGHFRQPAGDLVEKLPEKDVRAVDFGGDRDGAQKRAGGLVEAAQAIVGDAERQFQLRAVPDGVRVRLLRIAMASANFCLLREAVGRLRNRATRPSRARRYRRARVAAYLAWAPAAFASLSGFGVVDDEALRTSGSVGARSSGFGRRGIRFPFSFSFQ